MKKKSTFRSNSSYFLLKLVGPLLDYLVAASFETIFLTHVALVIVCCIGVVAGFYADLDINTCTTFGAVTLAINSSIFLLRFVFKYKKEHTEVRIVDKYFEGTEFGYHKTLTPDTKK